MNWYKTLDINRRIALKELCKALTGATFEELGLLFSLRERVEILHQKLQLEGFSV